MARRPQPPYWPGPVPDDTTSLPAYIEYELNRIREQLSADPVSFAISEEGVPVTIPTVLVWNQAFVGVAPTWDIPGGQIVGGVWTVLQSGLYMLSFSLTIAPSGSGNKTYFAGIQIELNGTSNQEAFDGGSDDVPLTVSRSVPVYLNAGDEVRMYFGAQHEQAEGATTASAYWSAVKASTG